MAHKFEQQPPELKDGIIHQQFRVSHRTQFKQVNRLEKAIADFIWANYEKGNQPERIEQFRERLLTYVNTLPKSLGSLEISEVKKGCSIMGHPNWIEREFRIYAPGRTIDSITVFEDIFIDVDNNNEIVKDLVYNKRIIGLNPTSNANN